MSLIKSLSFLPTQQHTGNKFLSSFNYWILDSGTTDHICSSLTHFTSYHQIIPISVKLPNGNQVITNYFRSIFINQDNVLDNVLYIPNFTFSLLSVAKLIDNLSCVIIFYSNGCHIKGQKLLKKWFDKLRCKVDFIYSGSLFIKTFKSNLSNLHISPILSILLL